MHVMNDSYLEYIFLPRTLIECSYFNHLNKLVYMYLFY